MDPIDPHKIMEIGDQYERADAIASLGDCGRTDCIPFLLNLLNGPEVEQDDGLGGAIYYALHEMGGVDAYVNSPSFSQLLESDKAECKIGALEQLIRFSNYVPWITYELIKKSPSCSTITTAQGLIMVIS